MTKEQKIREIDQAVTAGNAALKAIEKAESSMSGARRFVF